ncbi:hypothetical protein NONI108955_24025 [Nocardia ninae]
MQLRRRLRQPFHRGGRDQCGDSYCPPRCSAADPVPVRGQRHRDQRPHPRGLGPAGVRLPPRTGVLRRRRLRSRRRTDHFDCGRSVGPRAPQARVPAHANGPPAGPRRFRRGSRLPQTRRHRRRPTPRSGDRDRPPAGRRRCSDTRRGAGALRRHRPPRHPHRRTRLARTEIDLRDRSDGAARTVAPGTGTRRCPAHRPARRVLGDRGASRQFTRRRTAGRHLAARDNRSRQHTSHGTRHGGYEPRCRQR